MKKLFLTDNGALLCEDHLGATAAATGRDISGQKIQRLTATDAAELKSYSGRDPECETCRYAKKTA